MAPRFGSACLEIYLATDRKPAFAPALRRCLVSRRGSPSHPARSVQLVSAFCASFLEINTIPHFSGTALCRRCEYADELHRVLYDFAENVATWLRIRAVRPAIGLLPPRCCNAPVLFAAARRFL